MKQRSFGSLRVRLALVVLLAVIPALGLIYYNAREQRENATAQTRENVARLARLTAAQNTRAIDGARQLLVTLAQLPEVRDGDRAHCETALLKLLADYGFYSNLGVVTSDGNRLCSAVPLDLAGSVVDAQWFQHAMKTREFSVGGYEKQTDREAGNTSLYFGYPIVSADNQVRRVLFAALDLAGLSWRMRVVLPLEGVELAVVDRNGIVLGQTGGPENRVGRTAPEASQIKEASIHRGSGADQWFDTSGVERIYAFCPIGGKRAGVDLYVTASIPTTIAFAVVDRQVKRNLLALGVVALLALAAAWYGGEAILLRQTNDELERRVQERTRELMHEQFLIRTLLDNIPDSIYFKDRNGRFLRSSRAQAKRFGLNDPVQAIGKTDFDFFTKEHAQQASADEQQIIQTGQPLIGMEEHSPLADGTDRWVSSSKLPLRDEKGTIVGTFGISREITQHKRAEQALAKERNLLRTLIDNLPDLVSIKDLKGRYAFDNTAHRTVLGVSSLDDIVGKTVFDFYPKEVAERLHSDDEAVLAAGVPILRREEDLLDRKGRKTRAITSKIPYRDEQHKVAGLVCISHMVGELK